MSYVNADGLEVLTAGEQGTAAKRGTSLSSQNKAVACDGAAVGGTATVGGADVYVEAIYGTAAFTAGEAKLVIEYIEP